MINNELLEYIRKQMSLNAGKETIVANLKGAGWNDADISEAWSALTPVAAPVVPPVSTISPATPVASPIASPVVSRVVSPVTPSTTQIPRDFFATKMSGAGQSVSSAATSHKSRKGLFVLIVLLLLLGGAAFGFWQYRPQVMSAWNSFMDKTSELFIPFMDEVQTIPLDNRPVETIPTVNTTTNTNTNTTTETPVVTQVEPVKEKEVPKQAPKDTEKESLTKSHISIMIDESKTFYANNGASGYAGLCLSDNLKTSRISIEYNGGREFVCKDAVGAYAVGVKISQNIGYWCIDSAGANKGTTTLPTGTACPR